MAVTQIAICNSALAKVGQAPISSIDQETRAAQILKSIFDLVQDEVMSAHPWNFALKRVALTPTASTPAYEFDYEYDLPNDCLRVLELETDVTAIGVDWVVEGRKILSNDSEISIRYIYRNDDYNSWSPAFAEVMAWRLAQGIAFALTQSTEREKSCHEQLKATLAQARSTDGAEGVLRGLIADEWTTARR
jgi:hypothetical protein